MPETTSVKVHDYMRLEVQGKISATKFLSSGNRGRKFACKIYLPKRRISLANTTFYNVPIGNHFYDLEIIETPDWHQTQGIYTGPCEIMGKVRISPS